MDHTYQSTTVEMNNEGYESLQNQILNSKSYKDEATKDIRDKEPTQKQEATHSKKFLFTKGDNTLELDDDYEVEIMADKRPVKLTLKELRERAAGEIAVKNRMHSLAEEKKRVQATFKEYARIAKDDPLAALEYISELAREADSEFEHMKYLEKLAEQAEKLGQMDEKDRKAAELEKKLKKAESDLSLKARAEDVALRKQTLLSNYPEIGDQQFGDMVQAVLNNDDLQDGIENEHDFMDRVEDLMVETLIQRDVMSVIKEVNPKHLNDESLIFMISDAVRENPDFDEEDVRDLLREIIGNSERPRKQAVEQREYSDEREHAMRALSEKARQSTHPTTVRTQNASEYEILQQKLLERKGELSKTPMYKR